MGKLLLSGIVLALIISSLPAQRCTCLKAGEQDLPHGANMHIEYPEKTVKSIKGRIVFAHEQGPADDVVVEVYEIPPRDKKLQSHEIVSQHQRRAACITSKDGSFCFDDLPSGRYLIKAGTRSRHAGWNEVYARVKIDRSWWRLRSGGEIELELHLGT